MAWSRPGTVERCSACRLRKSNSSVAGRWLPAWASLAESIRLAGTVNRLSRTFPFQRASGGWCSIRDRGTEGCRSRGCCGSSGRRPDLITATGGKKRRLRDRRPVRVSGSRWLVRIAKTVAQSFLARALDKSTQCVRLLCQSLQDVDCVCMTASVD